MVPMNFYAPGKPVDMLHTGAWTLKAIEELKKIRSTADGRLHAKPIKFVRMPRKE